MASISQTDPSVARRLRGNLSAQLSTRDGATRGSFLEDGLPTQGGLEEEVNRSIRSIERVVENFGVLREDFLFHRDLVGDLRAKLDAETVRREEVQHELVGLDRSLKAERDRAAKAESHVKQSEGLIKDLEQQMASLQSQVSRLVKAIGLLVSAEIEVRGEAG